MKINKNKILEVRNLNVKYTPNQKSTIKNFTLDLCEGDHLAIIGPSGCGKSTIAKTIINMLPEEALIKGQITISGEDIKKIDKKEIELFRRKNFGFIYQDSLNKLNPLMTVGDHVYELFQVHFPNKPFESIKDLVEETFRRVGIERDRLDSFPHEFSGGMRQRVSIAMALALKPKILIADEPTTSLDTKTSFEVMNEILYLSKQSQTTLILISHDINLAAKWCKKVAIMEQGCIHEQGDIQEVFKSPISKIGKKLIKATNISLQPIKKISYKNHIILEANNLRHWYKLNSSIFRPKWNKALKEVSFKLYRNETLGIVGSSGSGKSTLCRALIGLLKVRGGEIKVYDNGLKFGKKKSKNYKNIQIIFQDPFSSLNPKMKIKNILKDIFLIQKIYNNDQIKNEIQLILENLNLPSDSLFLNSYPCQLSGGQLQRISIARSLLLKPKILICDESVNMLDAYIKIEILELLRKIQEKMDFSIIFITHDLGIAKNFCNRLLVMDYGKIIEEGDSSTIFSNPKNNITKALVESCLNLN
ncbi:ABC transporter, ATP binding component [Prochlorococcus marinus str. MIT 9515]|uniref:ABC transporter, ATP binding component n=1 Tax=Prochlorococcus marinus (strain MIT 9515) TaxID=167542 RepID=A2BUG9_PROM5|nr:ABC transporter ATP-binding protein [Prochlorococcus marinus]ABM71430.1 ABC transporter, ATP binding component [Prochlorococcus marinus str. MIT 9515]